MNTPQKEKRNMPRSVSCMRFIAAASVLILVLSLLPLYGAARYSYAGMDDYRYGRTTHAVWAETHSVAATFAEAGRVAAETYTTWQGSLAAIFLMSLEPGVFSDGAYGLSTVLLLSVIVLALVYFVYTLLRHALKTDGPTALVSAAWTAFCAVQFVPAPVESYYWFNGGVYYTFFFALALLAAALLMRRARQKTTMQCVLLTVLCAAIGLGNLVTGLMSAVLLMAYTGWQLYKKRRDPLTVVALAVLLAAFLTNALAPGNAVRASEHAGEGQNAVAAIFAALADTGRYAGSWMTTPAPYLMLLMIPLLWRWAGTSALSFRRPAAVTIASYLLLGVGFTPNEYALGFAGEMRIVDIQYYLFLLLWLTNLVWYTGWLRRHARFSHRAAKVAAATLTALALCAAGVSVAKTHNCAGVSALRLQTGGKARSYAQTWETRLAILHDESQAAVVLPKCETQPPLLCMVELAADPADDFYFYNEQVAAYFHKTAVLREP